MHRRTFLRNAAAVAAAAASARHAPAIAQEPAMQPQIMTVRGPIAPDALGFTLPHEHVMVDFVGAAETGPHRYDPDEVVETVRPYLEALRPLGVDAFVDCTPAFLARDVSVLRRLSEAVGIHILTNTGYYGAMDDKGLPPHAFEETPDQIAARWVAEWEDGIDGTDVRPGFIKIGVDPGPLSAVDRKLVSAACRAHLQTGLVIACHTTDAAAIAGILPLLKVEGVAGDAFIWVHAHAVPEPDLHEHAAREGVWIELDGLAPGTVTAHTALVSAMRERGLLHRVMLSHDAGWYTVGEPGGGEFRGFELLCTDAIPALREAGCTDADIARITRDNPAEAFTVRKRPLQRSDDQD